MEDNQPITWRHFAWDIIVFFAVLASIVSVSLEYVLELDESEIAVLYVIDVAALTVFIADLWMLWTHFNGPLREFVFRNWLDVLSAIPVFRIIRIARYGRLLKLARMRRLSKLRRVVEVEEKLDRELVRE
ncbi:MAG: hypothetical protein GF416_05035 [Candidatus Altiarchaeales archaeon]|nr:hypothetical protein [Candidatus Altiarchaeales archaeon]MBD3416481.1 hypothetical protein [Candidatus Altiarchaeales archaeon]